MEWINTGLTALSMIGGALAWWSANKSRKARQEAENAEASAKAHLAAVQLQAEAVEELAAQGRPPLLSASHKHGDAWLLTNNSDETVTIDGVTNREDEGLTSSLTAGTHIPGRGSVKFNIAPVTLPNQRQVLSIQLEGHPEPLNVPYPPKPRS